MAPVKRLALAATFALFALTPLTVSATPSPSPSLDTVLAHPPTDFTELTTSTLHGEFTAHDWATSNSSGSGGVSPTETENTLNSDGFVDGYGKTYVQTSQTHALIEAIMAFKGGQGAKSALTSLETSDKSDPTYKHADTISGIDNYYGAHFVDTTSNTVGDLFVFSKGNDVFLIVAASTKDDVLSLATSQAISQYNSAPSSTIPTSQWPENATPAVSGGGAALGFVILAAVVIIAAGIFAFVVRSRRRVAAPVGGYTPMAGYPMGGTPMDAQPGYGMAQAPPVQAAQAPAGAVQMSDDGYYWWDGQTWKDATLEAPPQAQRSPDGTQWYDGKSWRPVPQPGGQGPTG
jgi:hypothetical protein